MASLSGYIRSDRWTLCQGGHRVKLVNCRGPRYRPASLQPSAPALPLLPDLDDPHGQAGVLGQLLPDVPGGLGGVLEGNLHSYG